MDTSQLLSLILLEIKELECNTNGAALKKLSCSPCNIKHLRPIYVEQHCFESGNQCPLNICRQIESAWVNMPERGHKDSVSVGFFHVLPYCSKYHVRSSVTFSDFAHLCCRRFQPATRQHIVQNLK
ncbi:hypothetical protein T4B_14140 [Trichinella pseudospiralis]|uniref:Uncharacterized protein n=1 Tax=Trichinella pseudospiralis TaxID=6337 RepID=A0A0V1GSL3_TRIPS|nr:hypothetical protein T4B_14140 [Trichinella pseudospiralis]